MFHAPTAIPAFSDNYIWAFHNGRSAVVVDPGDAGPVQHWLEQHNRQLAAILVTHHHPDHVGGIEALRRHHDVPVYGPAGEAIPGRSHALRDGDRLQPGATAPEFEVIDVPGHTLGHIAYYAPVPGWLFCGDTLFAGGCGRLFEGTPAQMHRSLSRLADLPEQTEVYCAHEYTLANLTFARTVSPQDRAVIERLERVRALRDAGRITLPSTIGEERRSNPFLRVTEAQLQAAAEARFAERLDGPVDCFAALRRWKDSA